MGNRDQRLNDAVSILADLPEGADRHESLHDLRIMAGTASPLSARSRSPLARAWNWAVDADYVSIGPAPIWWLLPMAGAVAWVAWVVATIGLLA